MGIASEIAEKEGIEKVDAPLILLAEQTKVYFLPMTRL
jgi:hypothetical protein